MRGAWRRPPRTWSITSSRLRFCHTETLPPQDVAAIAERVRRRALRWFARSGLLAADDARDMLTWDNGGFSLDALMITVRARRSPWSGSRRSARSRSSIGGPCPQRDGRRALSLTPLKLRAHPAALIPPP